MYFLFLIAFSLVYILLFKRERKSGFIINAVPAYVPKRKKMKVYKMPVPDDIPKFYFFKKFFMK